MHAITDITLK